MTEVSDSNNMNDTRSTRLSYWRIIPLSLVMCLLINLLGFGLRSLMFKGEIGELMLTLTISAIAAIMIGTGLISKQKKNLGWSFIVGGGLTLLFWIGVFYTLSTHGW